MYTHVRLCVLNPLISYCPLQSISAYFLLIYLFSISRWRRQAALQTVLVYEIRRENKQSSCTQQARICSNRSHCPTVCAPYTDVCECTVCISRRGCRCRRDKYMQLWISLCVSFLIPNSFSPPPHSTREDDREKSWAKRSPFEPFLAMILQTLCGGSKSARAVWNPAPVSRGNAWPEGLCVSKVCQGGRASRFSNALYKHWRLSSTGWISHTPDVKL